MINRIKSHPVLKNFIEETCCENGICVTFDDDTSKDDYLILKVDKYYASLKLEKTPPSVDCVIIRKCKNGGYGLTIVELKNISTSRGFDLDNLKDKFETTISDFIGNKFRSLLYVDYKDVKLFFVTVKNLYKQDLGLKYETLINIRFSYNKRKLLIQPYMPTPTIKSCY
ncbi:MAG: hypothetical protein JNK20_00885 [Flavipsychrobacter sp.]|nr:hypothetical protein [Flavipsychrobacter sp.]